MQENSSIILDVIIRLLFQEYTQKVNFKLFTLTQLIFILAQQYVQSCRIDVIVLLTQIITAFEKYYQYIIQSTNSGYASPKIIPAIPKIVTKITFEVNSVPSSAELTQVV
ncbi:Hypothetical_protein [Hexamita inflata]|uniref:Hypothetical_protein n=1 Tax=Hexamita inflata TaxID=28002 RepID=A0AA86TI37_9EUKA|nr:Hypothetical protein HINF_LOCUS5925 [Hexamita inflata]CAI9918281.1 Hypothetical protein HINF_LOCUS5926 [Hexamita inflata]CAI9918282.1 Hypothetical protein HINF_LOCUS5927 [Hexamita inflata]